jgi:hypothetical protein
MSVIEKIAESHLILLGVRPTMKPRTGQALGSLAFVSKNPTTTIAVEHVHLIMAGNEHTPPRNGYDSMLNWIGAVQDPELVPDFMLTELEPQTIAHLGEASDIDIIEVAETARHLVMARSLGSIAQRLVLSEIETQ